MSNLLPKEKLQKEWSTFRSRLLLVGGLVFLGAALFSGLAFLPSHIALRFEQYTGARQKEEKAGVLLKAERDVQEMRDEISRANTLLSAVSPIIFATSSPAKAINTALSLRPDGVTVNRITFIADEGSKIIIGGISKGRESVNQYKEALTNSGHFRSVAVPVGSLIGAESGEFSVTLSGIL